MPLLLLIGLQTIYWHLENRIENCPIWVFYVIDGLEWLILGYIFIWKGFLS